MADAYRPPLGTSLLIVDDDRAIVESLRDRFAARGYLVATASSGTAAIPLLAERPDVVLCDLQMPDGDGFTVLDHLAAQELDATVIVITAFGSIEKAVEAMRRGAWDFVQKPFDASLIEQLVRRAVERGQLQRSHRALLAAQKPVEFVAEDPKMTEVVGMAQRAAASDSTVLLLGESGTGKEVLAQAIHRWSSRATGPLVALNCAALTETLLESELFGHEKGAFTGADQRRIGRLETAHKGTLFLDEIGDVSPAFQAKLLRVLQERQFERVGGSETVQVDVRVVAATHRDLRAQVAAGAFREDLFYRLHVVALSLPPLRERPLDVMPLWERALQEIARSMGRKPVGLAADAAAALRRHPWPGNVRELRNVVERALVLCEDEINLADLPPELSVGAPSHAAPGDSTAAGFHAQVEAFRRQVIADALGATGDSRTEAAKLLGLQRTYLSRLIKQYGL